MTMAENGRRRRCALWRGAKIGSPRLQSWSELSNLGRRAETGVNYRNGKTRLSINFNRFFECGGKERSRNGFVALAVRQACARVRCGGYHSQSIDTGFGESIEFIRFAGQLSGRRGAWHAGGYSRLWRR